MKDPYLDDYDAYLNRLDRFAAPKRQIIRPTDSKERSRPNTWLVTAIFMFVGAGAIAPLFT